MGKWELNQVDVKSGNKKRTTEPHQTPHSPHFLSQFPYETNPDIGGPVGPPVPFTHIG